MLRRAGHWRWEDEGRAGLALRRHQIRAPREVDALAEAGLTRTRMLLQVHDELVFEVAEGEIARASEVIREVMESAAGPALQLTVPLGVEIGTGANWGAAH